MWTCINCGNILQETTHRMEKKRKDSCNVYCHRPYYDLMKELNRKMPKSSIAIFSDDIEEHINEILDDLTRRVPARKLREIFDGYKKAIGKEITKNPLRKKRLLAKRHLITNLNNSGFLDWYDTMFYSDEYKSKAILFTKEIK